MEEMIFPFITALVKNILSAFDNLILIGIID